MVKKLLGTKLLKRTANLDISKEAIISRGNHCVSKTDIRPNALKVLQRLQKSGFQAYLVGGSVRDLLLRKMPKDFDVATNAKPNEIRKLFRNCRLIGRRFRLAHIHFGREIIEVATFRQEAQEEHDDHHRSEHGLITRDNVYGNLQDDVWRRDFTINALYYDSSDGKIIDLTSGYKDLQQQTIRLIGDPATRYREDPVRMLRAIRFSAKLDFALHPDTEKPIHTLQPLFDHISPSRLFDEFVKLFHTGCAEKAFKLLRHYQLFAKLFPQTAELLDAKHPDTEELLLQTLRNTDERIQQNKPVTPAFILATMLWHPLLVQAQAIQAEGEHPLAAIEQSMGIVLRKQSKFTSIPRRLNTAMREIWLLQYRLPKRYGRRAYRTMEHPRFRAAYDFLLLRADIGEAPKTLAQWWTTFQKANAETKQNMIKKLNPRRRRKKSKPMPKANGPENHEE